MLLGNVYFPTGNNEVNQIQFLNALSDLLYTQNADGNPVVIGGDFNMVRDKNLDYFGHSTSKKQSKLSDKFEEFIVRFKVIDIWRSKNKDKRQYTYKQGNPFMQSRLDYWVISENLQQMVVSCDIIPSIAPDHSAVKLCVYNTQSLKSQNCRNYWKFNNSLINDSEYVRSMKEEILSLKEKLSLEIKDKRVLWDYMKMEIRRFTSKFSRKKSTRKKRKN